MTPDPLKKAQIKRSRRKGGKSASLVAGDGEDTLEVGLGTILGGIFLLLAIGASITTTLVWLHNPGCMGNSPNLKKTSAQSAKAAPTFAPRTPPPFHSPPPTPAPAALVGIQDCTADQMAKVKQQLPPEPCVGQPYTQTCSFTRATTQGCADPSYMRKFYAKKTMEQFNAVVTSCSIDKGFVQEILHVGSHDTKYNGAVPCNNPITPSAPVNKVQIHCLEGDILASTTIKNWANQIGAPDAIKVSKVRLARLGEVKASSFKSYGDTLDKLFAVSDDKLPMSEPIHVMKLLPFDPKNDPNDLSSLLGAMHMLHRVRYLEFGYHYLGEWSTAGAFRDLILSKLKDKGFACYWKGSEGNLWRITGCWQDHYGSAWWSNVACVNTVHDDTKELVEDMEKAFAATLAKTQRFGG